MVCGAPSSRAASATRPSLSSSRIQLDDTRRPSTAVTSSTTSTSKPCVAPSSMRVSTLPAPFAPNLKSAPTSTTAALSGSTSTVRTNSSGVSSANDRSKVSTRVACGSVAARRSSFCSVLTSGSGHTSGRSSDSGLRSKVTTTDASPRAAAVVRRRCTIARCPSCTPSNLPIVTTLGPKSAGTSERLVKILIGLPRPRVGCARARGSRRWAAGAG